MVRADPLHGQTRNLLDTTLLPNLHCNATENRWQSTASMYQYLRMDTRVNHDSPNVRWIVVLAPLLYM
eukprot:3005581-Amphidinium_carterae.1